MCIPLSLVYLPWDWTTIVGVFGPPAQVVDVSDALLGEPVIKVNERCGINADVVDDRFERSSVLRRYSQPCSVV